MLREQLSCTFSFLQPSLSRRAYLCDEVPHRPTQGKQKEGLEAFTFVWKSYKYVHNIKHGNKHNLTMTLYNVHLLLWNCDGSQWIIHFCHLEKNNNNNKMIVLTQCFASYRVYPWAEIADIYKTPDCYIHTCIILFCYLKLCPPRETAQGSPAFTLQIFTHSFKDVNRNTQLWDYDCVCCISEALRQSF